MEGRGSLWLGRNLRCPDVGKLLTWATASRGQPPDVGTLCFSPQAAPGSRLITATSKVTISRTLRPRSTQPTTASTCTQPTTTSTPQPTTHPVSSFRPKATPSDHRRSKDPTWRHARLPRPTRVRTNQPLAREEPHPHPAEARPQPDGTPHFSPAAFCLPP
jgi:hypothetical protein